MSSAPRSNTWSFTACLALAALLGACKGSEAPPRATPEVLVAEVIQQDVPVGMELVAQLAGYEDVEIRARVEGYLASIAYREGARVKKGELLFTIDDQPYRAALASAEAELARAQSSLAKADLDVSRFTPLARERAISQAELDNAIAAQRSARAQVDAQKALVENARLNVGYARITAPIDGIAGRAERKVGDLVGRGESTLLTTVSKIDPIRVSTAITEADYLRFARALVAREGAARSGTGAAPGAKGAASTASLQLADGSVHPYPGTLLFADRAVDARTGTLRVDLGFPNPDGTLRPGQYGKIRFTSETRQGALLVPERAVQELQGSNFLLVVGDDGKVENRKVKTGPRYQQLWVIEDGVKAGEKVVVEGFQRIRPDQPVKPVAWTAPAASPAPTAGK